MEDCIFCKINKKEIPSDIIYEDDNFFVIKDIAPKAPIHLLLIPKKHIKSLLELTDQDHHLISSMLMYTKELAQQNGLADKGYKIEINTGLEGGQEVMHLHIHFLGGKSFK